MYSKGLAKGEASKMRILLVACCFLTVWVGVACAVRVENDLLRDKLVTNPNDASTPTCETANNKY
jgi:hypothetical protein